MKTNLFKKIFLIMMAFLSITLIAGCDDKDKKDDDIKRPNVYYDNENDALVFSTQELDKVFNPFFSTSATDSNVVGMTQIGMISNDSAGKPVWGDDEAVVTKDYFTTTQGRGEQKTTTYYFALKNNVRFSNGTYLTIKDVLFNLYVYLDPAYSGSSTIYSTEIVGLAEYRTQKSSEKEQENFNKQFETEAATRITALAEACENILKEHSDDFGLKPAENDELLVSYLTNEYLPIGEPYDHILEDYARAKVLFKEELESDYSDSVDSYEDTILVDEEGKEYKNLFTTDVEMFLFNEGQITWNRKDGKLESNLINNPAELKTWTKEEAINKVYEDNIPDNITEIIQYWNTSIKLSEEIVSAAKEAYFKEDPNRRIFKNISGIQFANKDEAITVTDEDGNVHTYDKPEYNDDGSVKSGNEVLSITIKKVDPKAIWNFSFAVAPMYYYSDQEHIDAFDYVENFGVEYQSIDFMNDVIKGKGGTKIDVPVGAGPYAASKSSGGISGIKGGDFYDKNVVYFERNPYYIMGEAKIKKVRFQVVPQSQMITNLTSGAVDFVEPNAKPETETELNGYKKDGVRYKQIETSGYGYIGINAGKVPDIKVRQAIMHAIDPYECVSYYQQSAQQIFRSMSKVSWAYPKNSTAYYPYIKDSVPENLDVVNPDYKAFVEEKGYKTGEKLSVQHQEEFIRRLVEDAGYSVSAGIYKKGTHTLKYTFTIAGEQTDHPAWQALYHASEILNRLNFQITVTTDAQALKKLSEGKLTVWAAAWGSTIDPDMYQVYHMDSTATSTLNWGYKQILQNKTKYSVEYGIISDLSEIIEQAREVLNETQRAALYSDALDLVMELAVELPTYQRNDLFAYNAFKIDVNTFNKDLSPYKGLTSDMHLISLYEEK